MKRIIEFDFNAVNLTEQERLYVINAYLAGAEMVNDSSLEFKEYLRDTYDAIAGLIFEDECTDENIRFVSRRMQGTSGFCRRTP